MTRLCLDHLKSARHRRETYIGPWLPEPVVEASEDSIDDVTLPLLMALERLTPLERAAFLLHDVFGVSFEEIAETIGREPAACRQLVSRARIHVRAARPRFDLPKERGLEIAAAFFTATRSGDMKALRSLLAADVTIYADGGDHRRAASLSTMAQATAYLIAATGPVAFGWLHDLTTGWMVPMMSLVTVTVIQAGAAMSSRPIGAALLQLAALAGREAGGFRLCAGGVKAYIHTLGPARA